MSENIGIAELCAEYAKLATERADLDRRIEELGPAILMNKVADAVPFSASAEAAADILWIELEGVLGRQRAVVKALIDQAVSDTGELQDKARVLAKVLQDAGPTEADFARRLTLSLLQDVLTPSCSTTPGKRRSPGK